MTEEDYLQLSGIQHFCFCRRQWALIHVEDQWNENLLTAEGRLQHERVHDPKIEDVRNGVVTMRSMMIKSDALGVSGQCDAVEFIPSQEGISLSCRKGLWEVRPVEYKHGSTKANDCDRLQVAAQAMCLEEMLCCHIPTGDLFYAKTRRREHVEITDDLRRQVEEMFREMHQMRNRRYTPKVAPTAACASCSLEDVCLPKLLKNRKSVREYVLRHIREDAE
ncbi:MAG: CRISPR-associated protein Cas4 [Christensenellales bacterium]|jgi:CRISPR-associated exonuclease Cas4